MDSGVIANIMNYGPAFLLIAARALVMIETAPLLSSDAIPQAAKIALAGFAAYAVFPHAAASAAGLWRLEPYGLNFVYLLIGEALIGLIIGFFMTIIFAAFSTAGQFFSLQRGFGASETFDPL